MQQDQPFNIEHGEFMGEPTISVRALLRGKWSIVAASKTELWIEDVKTYKGVALYVKINRKTGAVNPHDGSMFAAPHDQGTRQWYRMPAYARRFVMEHGNAMIAAKFPGTEDAQPTYNTINGIPITGQAITIA